MNALQSPNISSKKNVLLAGRTINPSCYFIMGMDILLYLGLFLISLVVLIWGSDWFVDSAEKIGLGLGISPFIIGVTIVAFGTSLPELASSIAAVFIGESEIVVGNVVGSNITNLLLVLGIVAIVSKQVQFNFRVMDIDTPLLVSSAFFLWFVLRDLAITMPEAILFLVALGVFLISTFKGEEEEDKKERSKISWLTYLILVVAGALVYLGANYTIVAIQKLSEILGIQSGIIALTLVALGTSLPEVVVSVTAARRGKSGIAIGNVLGSNIFNTYAVMGIPALIAPLEIPASILDFSLPLMVAVTVIFGVVCVTHRISRWEGVMFVLFYLYFILELVKDQL